MLVIANCVWQDNAIHSGPFTVLSGPTYISNEEEKAPNGGVKVKKIASIGFCFICYSSKVYKRI